MRRWLRENNYEVNTSGNENEQEHEPGYTKNRNYPPSARQAFTVGTMSLFDSYGERSEGMSQNGAAVAQDMQYTGGVDLDQRVALPAHYQQYHQQVQPSGAMSYGSGQVQQNGGSGSRWLEGEGGGVHGGVPDGGAQRGSSAGGSGGVEGGKENISVVVYMEFMFEFMDESEY